MKKMLTILLTMAMALTLVACGSSEKTQEEIIEKIIEKSGEGKVDVEIDGDKYTYEDADGNKIEIGSTEWPTGKLAELVPKFDKATISSVITYQDGFMVQLLEVDKEDYEDYLQKVQDAGFTKDSTNIDTGTEGSMYQASLEDGTNISLIYVATEKSLQIVVAVE
ncbi:MAG: hypothetical protein RSE93_07725 [Oscillospiraceae bacterium]